jgi:Domain of unknown function (DUF4116)
MGYASPREVALNAVQQSGNHLDRPDIAGAFSDDKEVALMAVQTTSSALQYCSPRLRDDKEVVMASLVSSVKANCGFEQLSHVSPRLLADREVAQYVLYNSPQQDYLFHFSELIKADRNLIVTSRNSIRYASDEIKADPVIVADAVAYRPNELQWASESLRGDRAIVISAVSTVGYLLQYASPQLQDDIEIVKIAVKNKPGALEYASPRLRNNLEIILYAVTQDHNYGHFASKDIKKLIGDGDPVEILTKAVQSEKLAAKLSAQLKPKSAQQERTMKI